MNTVRIKGIKPLNKKLTAHAAKFTDLGPMFLEMITEIGQAEAEWFASSGGGTWAPLSPEYAAAKAAKFPGKPILIATGELQKSIVTPAAAMRITSPYTMDWVSDRMTEGSNPWNLAYLHREGTPTMPSRDPTIPYARAVLIASLAAQNYSAWKF